MVRANGQTWRYDYTLLKDYYPITVPYRGDPVSDNDDRTVLHLPLKSFLYLRLRIRIHTTRCFIEDKYPWISQNCPC